MLIIFSIKCLILSYYAVFLLFKEYFFKTPKIIEQI